MSRTNSNRKIGEDAAGGIGAKPENVGFGIALAVLAMLLIAAMDATGKLLTQNYPIAQVLAVRFVIFSAFALFLALKGGSLVHFRTRQLGAQVLRAGVLIVEVSVFIWAFSLMPLADAHAIAAVAPLIATMLAGVFLGERIGLRRWICVAAGFVGALVIIRPGLGVMTWTAVLPLAGAFLWAGYQVLSRKVTLGDSAETTVLFTAGLGAVVFCLAAAFQWQPPTAEGWMLLALTGVLGSLGHYILIKALEMAPASTLQPYNYTLFLWAIGIGLIVFDALPDMLTLLGAAIIVVAGIAASDAGRSVLFRLKR